MYVGDGSRRAGAFYPVACSSCYLTPECLHAQLGQTKGKMRVRKTPLGVSGLKTEVIRVVNLAHYTVFETLWLKRQ